MKNLIMRFYNEVHHKANPLHVYCRLVEAGVAKKRARNFARRYEYFFNFLNVSILNIVWVAALALNTFLRKEV